MWRVWYHRYNVSLLHLPCTVGDVTGLYSTTGDGKPCCMPGTNLNSWRQRRTKVHVRCAHPHMAAPAGQYVRAHAVYSVFSPVVRGPPPLPASLAAPDRQCLAVRESDCVTLVITQKNFCYAIGFNTHSFCATKCYIDIFFCVYDI